MFSAALYGHLLRAALCLVDFLIDAAAALQLLVGALLHDSAPIQNDDLVRGGEGGDPVGDQNDTGLSEAFGDCLPDPGIGLGVHSGEGIVEDHNGGVLGQHPGNGGTLLLTAGEGDAPFANHGVVALGKGSDGLIQGRSRCGAAYILWI